MLDNACGTGEAHHSMPTYPLRSPTWKTFIYAMQPCCALGHCTGFYLMALSNSHCVSCHASKKTHQACHTSITSCLISIAFFKQPMANSFLLLLPLPNSLYSEASSYCERKQPISLNAMGHFSSNHTMGHTLKKHQRCCATAGAYLSSQSTCWSFGVAAE